ncbi:ferredoxin [Streptomyces cinnamoneus]|uniref:Ferredoxin n=1 Tax=Streptomyces cinnamoneus TaxID=53446 RepID=A0A918TZ27_STRCJ|nr:ferredoxin [Streptomyces cinnamoneus]GHC69207.1 ferredoxin [Streptomyces cinnamoneus]
MSAPRWRVSVDRALCVGSGQCAGAAPAAFRLDGARRAHPVAEETDPSAAVLDAAEGCPVEAVLVRELGTGRAVFPPDEPDA